MGYGLLKLASIGNENMLVSTRPQITFFKKNFAKYSFFSIEQIPQYFKSVPSFGRKVTLTLSKEADLLGDLHLYVELPDIPLSKHSILPSGIKKFAWVKKIGLAMIDFIDLEIDGRLIQRHYNDWLNIYYNGFNDNLDMDKILGNIDILTDYNNGKTSYKLYIPLKFFFNLDSSLFLPICALNKQDIKIHVKFNDFNKCYNTSPTHYFTISSNICLYKTGEYIRQTIDNQTYIGRFVYFDMVNQRVYYDKIYGDFKVSTMTNTSYNITGDLSGFKVQPTINSIIVKDESYFYTTTPEIKDSYIIANYVYLDVNEKNYFKTNKHQYIVPLVQNILDKNINSVNNNYKLQLTNPHKILFWRGVLQSNIELNDIFNYTSYPLTSTEQPLIISNKLYINSIPRMNIGNYEFYTYLQNYTNKLKIKEYIYNLSFGNNIIDIEPSGTFNFSKIDDAYIQLNLNKLVNYQNYINIRAYGYYYNIYVINNETSAFKFI